MDMINSTITTGYMVLYYEIFMLSLQCSIARTYSTRA